MDTPIPVFIAKCVNVVCGRVVQLRNVRSNGEATCFLIEQYWKPVDVNGRSTWLCSKCAKLLPGQAAEEGKDGPTGLL